MALGLFCTLIIGTIIGEIGFLINKAQKNAFGDMLSYIGTIAKMLMGAGIGVGIANSLKAKKLTSFSAAVAGMVGANITNIFALSGIHVYGASANPAIGIGDPVGAFVAAVAAIEVTRHVEGKTPIDILVVPLCAITCGTLGAVALGIPFGILFALLGKAVSLAIGWEPISFGILVAVVMGLLLTLPTSSAAFGVMLFQSSLINTAELTYNARIGAAAACAGCCAHMVGFAVASFRENKWSGVVSQGIGTSMLQIPNLGKNPRILLPAIAASAVSGPLASAAFKIMCDPTGSGMGTAGLVGVIQTFITSIDNGIDWWYVLIAVLVCYIIVPAMIALGVSELMRKKKWIKLGDMKI
ncbi:MAG: PTS sugar transporter subunit IIC [Clostridiales bacterium]|nr:PTS sugar transporter subunit IIC [Clostridiales bacterium]